MRCNCCHAIVTQEQADDAQAVFATDGTHCPACAESLERWAVINVNSRELLSDWVDSLAEAHAIADDVEQHESQPEVDVISLSRWNERTQNPTNSN